MDFASHGTLSGMADGWEQEAPNWIAWARKQGHDAYWYYSPAFFQEIVPGPRQRTLEVGCGEGRVARDMRDRGHEVVPLDASPTLLAAAAEADNVSTYVLADAAALPFHSETFDIIVAYNSLMDIDDLRSAVKEIGRVLTHQGAVCVCITHPINDAGRFEGSEEQERLLIEGSYFERRLSHEKFERDGLEMTFHSWLTPFETYARAFEEAGFVIETLREPQPTPEAIDAQPSLVRWRRIPMFLFLRLRKREEPSG